MPCLGPRLTITWLLAVLLAGCRLPGREGPVSRSVATCRQLSQQGIAALERGQPQQAEALLAKAVDACPLDSEARRHYAEALWRSGARPEAIAQLEEACRAVGGYGRRTYPPPPAGDDATLRVRLAEMHLLVGQWEQARLSAQQALDLDPKLPAAWAMRGRVLQAGGQPLEALANFHRALGYAPQDRQVLLEVAELYRQLNWPQRALATLQSLADTYSPGEEPQQVLHLMGLTYTALGRYDDAVESLSAAAVRAAPTPEIFCHLAEAELQAGHPAEAEAAARRALALQPQHGPSRQLLRRLELARQPQVPPHR
jgi:tetratricopeptide (TPR) repeat protein